MLQRNDAMELMHPADRFDPLLRDLLSFGLIFESEPGTWVMHRGLGQRLAELASVRRPDVIPVVRFGHRCDGCPAMAPTRLTSGRFLCESCRAAVIRPTRPGSASNQADDCRLVAGYRRPGKAR